MCGKVLIVGMVGFCLFNAERATAQRAPFGGAAPAGMDRGSTLNNRLNDAERNVNRCRDDMNRRDDELKKDNEARGYTHSTGQRRGPDGVENDNQYSKLKKKYDDAVKQRDGIKNQLPPDVNKSLDTINKINNSSPSGGSNVPRNADTNPK